MLFTDLLWIAGSVLFGIAGGLFVSFGIFLVMTWFLEWLNERGKDL